VGAAAAAAAAAWIIAGGSNFTIFSTGQLVVTNETTENGAAANGSRVREAFCIEVKDKSSEPLNHVGIKFCVFCVFLSVIRPCCFRRHHCNL
jgi:hypothetical protein